MRHSPAARGVGSARIPILVALLASLIVALPASAATHLFVDRSVGTSGDGASWATAFVELQEALDVAVAGTTVHIAEGTYLPDYDVGTSAHTGDIQASFVIPDGVDVWGGYPPGGADLFDHDPHNYPTVLSGDLAGDDAPGPANRDDNARHVVRLSGADVEIVGLTVSGGYAYGPDVADTGGAGIRAESSSLFIDTVTLTDNHADGAGGGLYANGNVVTTISRSTVIANTGGNGGGAFFSGGTGNVVQARILGNSGCVDCSVGINGGGLVISGDGLVSNSLISGNTAFRGAAMRVWFGSVTILNSTIVGNTSTDGSSIQGTDNGEALVARNSILWGAIGTAGEYGQFGSVDITYSVVPETPGTGNVSADPKYIDEDGADDVFGTTDDNVNLWPDSPAIDAGNNDLVPADTFDVDRDGNTTEPHPDDLVGRPRRLDTATVPDTGVGTPPIVDMGAMENDGNRMPAAAPDTYWTPIATTLEISAPGVLGNDSDPDGDPLAAVLDRDVGNGTLDLRPDGSFTYTPDAGLRTFDDFGYHVTDGSFHSGTVTVQINITNSPPIAVSETASTPSGSPVTIDVLANDSDPDGDPLTTVVLGTLQVPPNWPAATVEVLPDQRVRYTPDPSFEGVDLVHYRVDVPSGLRDFADAVVAVGPVRAAEVMQTGDWLTTPFALSSAYPVQVELRAGSPGPMAISVTDVHGIDPADPGALGGYLVVDREVALYVSDVTAGAHRLVFSLDDSLLPPNVNSWWDTVKVTKNGEEVPTCGDTDGAPTCIALITDFGDRTVIELEEDPYGLGTEQGNVSTWNFGVAPEGRQAGDTRIETAVELSRSVFASSDVVLLARADNFADALAGGPLARKLGAPLLLTFTSDLATSVAGEIERLGATKVILLGGRAALSDGIAADLATRGVTVERIAGADRWETAALIGRRVGGTHAYLALGRHDVEDRAWPDALAVSGLAAFEGRPLLLTGQDGLPSATAAALGDMAVQRVTIVGGTAAVPSLVETQVRARGITVDRLAGPTRFGTSAAIADRAVAAGMDARMVWVTSGRNWPDALAAAPGNSAIGAVLVLVDPTDLTRSPETRDWLALHDPVVDDILVIGGTAAVSSSVEAQLRALVQ